MYLGRLLSFVSQICLNSPTFTAKPWNYKSSYLYNHTTQNKQKSTWWKLSLKTGWGPEAASALDLFRGNQPVWGNEIAHFLKAIWWSPMAARTNTKCSYLYWTAPWLFSSKTFLFLGTNSFLSLKNCCFLQKIADPRTVFMQVTSTAYERICCCPCDWSQNADRKILMGFVVKTHYGVMLCEAAWSPWFCGWELEVSSALSCVLLNVSAEPCDWLAEGWEEPAREKKILS